MADQETPEQKERRENQERIAKQQERDAQAAADRQEKEAALTEEITGKLQEYFTETGMTNHERAEFLARLTGGFGTGIRTVGAAAKLRQPVVEQAAEDGASGVQVKPLQDVVAGAEPKSGEALPTASQQINPSPGTKSPAPATATK